MRVRRSRSLALGTIAAGLSLLVLLPSPAHAAPGVSGGSPVAVSRDVAYEQRIVPSTDSGSACDASDEEPTSGDATPLSVEAGVAVSASGEAAPASPASACAPAPREDPTTLETSPPDASDVKKDPPDDPTASAASDDAGLVESTPVTTAAAARLATASDDASGYANMYRLYNPYSGEHFYTASPAEKDALSRIGWRWEGVGWTAPARSNTPVYRLYNPYAPGGDHHYTTSPAERDALSRAGWRAEGIGWYSDDAHTVPLYREYNPYARTGTHNYTASKFEHDNLLVVGWRGEGIGWYGVGAGKPVSTTLASPSRNGALRVSGAQLVDGSGTPVQLRGISTHGIGWFPQYVNADCFGQLRREWNANVVRIALYTEEYNGYCSGGDRTYLRNLVKGGIKYATDNDMYVIVDWHILHDGNPLTHVDEAKAFFQEIARQYGGQGNVIYEICNEPNGGCSWADIKRYASQVIPVIRQQDPDGIVIVGTPTWSQEVDKAAVDPLPYGNVAYALHFYATTHRDDLRNRMVRVVQGGLPVFVSEFGICDASGNGAIDQASADQWVATMNSLGVSYCMWSLSNKAESASAIKSSCTKAAGFTASDLSQSGSWLYRTLTGDQKFANLTDTTGSEPGSAAGGGGSGGWSPSVPTGTTYAFDSGGLRVRATLVNSWPSGPQTFYQYSITLSNPSGAALSQWQVSLPFSQVVEVYQGWNCTQEATGGTVTLRNASYNGSIGAGQSQSDIGVIVAAGAGLSLG